MENNQPGQPQTPSLEPAGDPKTAAKEPAPRWQAKLPRQWNWKLLSIVGAVLVCLVVFKAFRGGGGPAADSTSPATVAVARVTREDLAQEQVFEAEFRPFQEIELHPMVAGFVQSINVDIGDQLHQGDVLATLEIPELKEDLERAGAAELRDEKEINRAAAAYEDSHLAFTRLSAIAQTRPNLVAQQDLDTARAHDSASEATLAVAKQEVEVAKAELDKLKAMSDYCKITAPFTGVVTRRYADEGALVQGGVTPSSTGTALVRLSQNDRLRLDFPVSVSYVERIKIGEPVEIRIQALGKTISGKISRFTRKVDTDTRTMEAEVDVPNPDLSLTPGIYAEAALKLDRREQVLTVPVEAIANRKAPTAFVLNQQNEIEERPVTLGLETADRIEVASGLNENDLVLIGSRAQVKPGQKVQPKLMEIGSIQ